MCLLRQDAGGEILVTLLLGIWIGGVLHSLIAVATMARWAPEKMAARRLVIARVVFWPTAVLTVLASDENDQEAP